MSETPIDLVLRLIPTAKSSGSIGGRWSCKCPAHEDRENSCGIELYASGYVKLHCFRNCTEDEIDRALGITKRDRKPSGRKHLHQNEPLTVRSLSFERRLDESFLLEQVKLRDGDKSKHGTIIIPVLDATGKTLFERTRCGLKGRDSRQPAGKGIVTYGKWMVQKFRERGHKTLIFVEGETDSWTLWNFDFPALGVLGCTNTKTIEPEDVAGFTTFYVWKDRAVKEGDDSGQTFVGGVASRVTELVPGSTVKVLDHPECKDPNELLMIYGDMLFKDMFTKCMENSRLISKEDIKPPKSDIDLFTDWGNAKRLAKIRKQDMRYLSHRDCWYTWQNSHWAIDDVCQVNQWAKDAVQNIFVEASTIKESDVQAKAFLHAIRSQSAASLSAMVRLAKSEPGIPVRIKDMDGDPWLFNCVNATIDLKTGKAQEHKRTDLLTQVSPVEFHEDAECPLWERFLDTIFPLNPGNPDSGGNKELIGYIQRLFGYGLTGDIREHVLPILWGEGSNGKSTLIETVSAIFGEDYWATAPDSMLMVKRNESHPTELARIHRKRLVAASETEAGQTLNMKLVKRLTGGDKIAAHYMREDIFEFSPTHKLLMVTNEMPRINTGGHAIWRRVILIPFKVKFWKPELGEDGPSHLVADKTLLEGLKAEYSGILAWMVRGCLDWQSRGGLEPPEDIQAETMAYRESENPTTEFFQECCRTTNETIEGKEQVVSIGEMYDIYKHWIKYKDYKGGLGKKQFNKEFERKGVKRGRWSDGSFIWVGIVANLPKKYDGISDMDEFIR